MSFCRTKSEDQGRCNFSSAKLRAEKFAIVHIASAQFEYDLGEIVSSYIEHRIFP